MFGEGDLERLQDCIAENLYYYRGVCTQVYDGDSVTVDLDLGMRVWQRGIKCRLAGIDTPELRADEREAGLAARNRLRQLILNQEVIVHTQKTGKYGRWLVTIYSDGININQKLLAEGHATEYK